MKCHLCPKEFNTRKNALRHQQVVHKNQNKDKKRPAEERKTIIMVGKTGDVVKISKEISLLLLAPTAVAGVVIQGAEDERLVRGRLGISEDWIKRQRMMEQPLLQDVRDEIQQVMERRKNEEEERDSPTDSNF